MADKGNSVGAHARFQLPEDRSEGRVVRSAGAVRPIVGLIPAAAAMLESECWYACSTDLPSLESHRLMPSDAARLALPITLLVRHLRSGDDAVPFFFHDPTEDFSH